MNSLRIFVLCSVVFASVQGAYADEETVHADTHQVTVSTAGATLVDQAAELTVIVQSRGPYAIDQKSPISLQFVDPGDVEVPADPLQQGDAVLSTRRAEFRAVVKPRAVGERTLTLVLDFTLCDARACHQVDEVVRFKLRVR